MYENECSICLSDINIVHQDYITLRCSHTFHKKCIDKNINKLCPLCRYKYINNNNIDIEANVYCNYEEQFYKKILPYSCGLIFLCISLLAIIIFL